MPKRPNQKQKLLYLRQILEQESDEAHPLAVNDLIAALGRQGIAVERKSIYDDIAALQQFGLDVVTVRGRANAYYLGQRAFELPELKLLVDAVQSAKFITAGKSRQLIRKICALTSRHEGGLMQRQVHVQNRAKTVNERTYYNVDAIQSAIAADRGILSVYYEWRVDPKAPRRLARTPRHNGRPYRLSPWTLLWDDEFYYLIAWDDEAGQIKHFRVDKMDGIVLRDDKREGRAGFAALDIAEYSKGVFGMFGGQEQQVTLRFDNRLVGVVVDRFGTEVGIRPDGDRHFIITLKAIVSPQFFSWLFGFGTEAELLGPPEVLARARREAWDIADMYGRPSE